MVDGVAIYSRGRAATSGGCNPLPGSSGAPAGARHPVSIGVQPRATGCRAPRAVAGQTQCHDLERAHGERADSVADLETGVWLLEQVAHAGGAHRRSQRTVIRVRLPTASWSRTIRSLRVVVGEFDGVDLDPAAGDGDDRSGCRWGVAVSDAQRHREALRLVEHVAQPGSVREQRQVHGVRSTVGVRVGVARRAQDSPAPARRTTRGRSGRR